MESPNDEDWRGHLASVFAEALGASVGTVETIASAGEVADGTLKLLARDRDGVPAAVALCSGAAAPDMVARAMERASLAREALGAELARVIIEPIAEGRWEERSWCVLPFLENLSRSRLVWILQRRRLRPALFGWLRSATAATLREPSEEEVARDFRAPLAHLAAMESATSRVRAAAEAAGRDLEAGLWSPRQVLIHNDLWKGNILIDSRPGTPRAGRPWAERFVLIDWPGARVRGHALFDLLRLARSLGSGRRALAAEVDAHCAILGCEREQAQSHLLAALAYLSAHLEQFSEQAFARVCASCLDSLEALAS